MIVISKQLDQADEARFLVLVGELSRGRGDSSMNGRMKIAPIRLTSMGCGIEVDEVGRLEGDEHDERVLEDVVVDGAEKLGPEERREAALAQELELVGGADGTVGGRCPRLSAHERRLGRRGTGGDGATQRVAERLRGGRSRERRWRARIDRQHAYRRVGIDPRHEVHHRFRGDDADRSARRRRRRARDASSHRTDAAALVATSRRTMTLALATGRTEATTSWARL